MSEADEYPIAYTALQPGTPVQTTDGHQFGAVRSVLVDELVSVFDGIVVDTPDGRRFVDADQIGRIYTSHVRTTLTRAQAAELPEPDGSTVIAIKPGGRLSRMFGRGRR